MVGKCILLLILGLCSGLLSAQHYELNKIQVVNLLTGQEVLFELFSCFSQKIDNYLKLAVSAMSDTVSYGDSLQLDIVFENISDKECLFYPKANLILENNDLIEVFGIDDNRFYKMNSVIDLTFIQKISPKHRYKMTYFIPVDSSYLSKGENVLFLNYILGENMVVNLNINM